MPHDDDMLERSQSLLRSATSRRHLTDFFSRALSAFQSPSDSAQNFQVVCTAPPASSSNASCSAAGAHEAQGKPLHPQSPAPIPPTKRPHTLIVLDSSFNPPTLAHLRMATSAVRDTIKKKRRGEDAKDMSGLRLLLLLAVVNADKAPKPAAFDQRLAMMWAFAHDVQRALRGEADKSPVEVSPASGPGPKPEKSHIHDSSQLKAADEEQQKQGVPQVDISVDIGLTSKPYFHEKSRVIAESEFYKPPQEEGEEDTMEQVILVGFDTLIRIFNPKYYGPATQVTAHAQDQSRKGSPIQQALDPMFKRAKLRVTLRTDDEWGGKQEQVAYLESLLSEEGLAKIGGSKEWAERIELVEGRRDGEEIVSSTYARKAAEREEWGKLRRLVSPEVGKWIEGEKLYVVDVKPEAC
ncbi:hypothetical protein GE21DRAFT_3610 [Neurospora crassa]|uniref:Cytidylyltransferase n=2 Tax=Neurospora crassa TaxID=5141 RepID=Q7SCF9_NEUCR|nr:cytidylyltransferase [Neurospora crassa OR74A]EAA34361.3 cytidylyltransferase [Neurospora crassa OR74A]KHE82881.1 hypothetical protein GE21DRAFT_3610 [Neurospora crassa]CAE75694.1 conserved hypothetical protein [Neurospora crassa]|eukprot:XP_963597.3 cytidylyltransferase [Neurospora crassa OR74A]